MIEPEYEPGVYTVPEWADLRCPECGGKVSLLTVIVSDAPVHPINEGVWMQAGPRVMGWNTVPCLHFVDTEEWNLSCKVSEVDGSSMTFERCGQGAAEHRTDDDGA